MTPIESVTLCNSGGKDRSRQVEHGTDNLCNQLCEEGINQRIEIQRSLELQDSSCKSTRLFLTYIASSFSQQD